MSGLDDANQSIWNYWLCGLERNHEFDLREKRKKGGQILNCLADIDSQITTAAHTNTHKNSVFPRKTNIQPSTYPTKKELNSLSLNTVNLHLSNDGFDEFDGE